MNKLPSFEIIKQIDDYLKGRLDRKKSDELWEHMLKHPEFHDYMKVQAGLRKQYLDSGKDPGRDDGNSVKEDKTPWYVAIAAVIIITLLLNIFRSTVDHEINPVIDEIPLSYLITPDIERSSNNDLSDLDNRLMEIYFSAVSGSLQEAITQYEDLLNHTDGTHKHNLLFNIGVLHFNDSNYKASAEALGGVDCKTTYHSVRKDRCLWIKINSFLAVEDHAKAAEYASKLAESSNTYHRDAINLLQKMEQGNYKN